MPLIQDYNKLFEHTDDIKKVILNGNIVWPAAKPATGPDYTEPFYVENITNENETLSIVRASITTAPSITIEYKTDNTDWDTLGTTSTTPLTLPLAPGEKVYLKCNTNTWGGSTLRYNAISGVSKVGGNIMSLLYGDNFADKTSFPIVYDDGYTFNNIFYNNNRLQDVTELLLPATTLSSGCYSSMFSGCTSLNTVPELPATTLSSGCYSSMFYGCTSLNTVPVLPATTLSGGCYSNMFYGCTSLNIAPVLPATTLSSGCYSSMFSGCTSLNTVPVLPATTLASYCYYQMFYGCTSLNIAPVLPATTLAEYCYSYMFYGCTSLTSAPALPATTLADNCYYSMFYGCTSLTTAPVLPATTLASYCYYQMFYGCTSLTQSPELPAPVLLNYCYQYMFMDCTSLNKVTCLATSGIRENNSTSYWLMNVSSTGTFTKAAGVSWIRDVSGIPSGWTVIEV